MIRNIKVKFLFFLFSLIFGSGPAFVQSAHAEDATLENWCKEVKDSISKLKWKIDPCDKIQWKQLSLDENKGPIRSVKGRPLVYAEFGDPTALNTTLVFATVHGDEVTPLYLGIKLTQWLKENQGRFIKTRVVVAPLVNPDGFLNSPKTRTNANKVDLNRNFATQDFRKSALVVWTKKYRKDPRRNPGKDPESEPETIFQQELIRVVKPQKILSIHSPLNFLDYDGPNSVSKKSIVALEKFPDEYAAICQELKKKLKAISSGYFVGSLGNYAGRERGIPTLTLELPSADPSKAEVYWKKFSQGIDTMIQFPVPSFASGKLNALPGT